MPITRHKVDYWIKNNYIDVSIKDIEEYVTPHWHEFYEIEVILSGSGKYSIDGIDYNIERGALYFLSPSSIHEINFGKGTRLINFMFTLDVCEPEFLCGFFDNSPHVMFKLSDEDIDYINILAKNIIDTNSHKYQAVMLNSVLGKIHSFNKNYASPLKDAQMQYAILYIQNHFKEDIKLKDVAEIANYTPNYFGNKFKAYMGVTFKKYVMDLQFSLVEKMLKNSKLSITEICFSCGFKDFSNFMLHFKNRYGVSPKLYRLNKTK